MGVICQAFTRSYSRGRGAAVYTLGIYTPMDIRVTCAEAPATEGALLTPADTTETALAVALDKATLQAGSMRIPVYVQVRK
jgi:hypothetical protein